MSANTETHDTEPTTEQPDYWNEYYEDIPFDEAAIEAEQVIDKMEDEFEEGSGWARVTDVTRVWTAIDEGFDAYHEEKKELKARRAEKRLDWSSRAEITFPNERLAVIWYAEICGQISDGAWENHDWPEGLRDWKNLCYADVEVDTSMDEADAKYLPDALDYKETLTRSEGHEERMIFFVRLALGLDDYSHDELREDLEKLDSMNGLY